ncbi:glycosyltransferase family 4 protein [Proteiniclasticum sp.]|uniref:glycosyltransferase family 4 protein n=1 Tax=Proteiniclasticum sp. TaxID=2053595 RepID=UPI00289EB44E|nr:glycosyltransferase family 4 protein [Proteiniclasticum sp.]
MKILIVGQVFYPDNFRINDIVKELAKENEVKVITGLPDYDLGRVPEEYRFFKKRREDYFGAEVIRVPIISRRKGPVFRSLNYMSYVLSGSIYALFMREKYDIVFSFQTSPITMFVPGLVYAKKHKIRSLLYTLDLWPESVKAMNINESSPIFSIIRKMSRKIYHGADYVLTSSPSFKDYLVSEIGLNDDKIAFLPQYTDEEDVSDNIVLRKDYKSISFTFAGNIGLVQDVETIVRAAEIIKANKFIINIVGSGSNQENIKAMVEECGLTDHFIFHGRKSHKEMNSIYRDTDVCIITLKNEGFIGRTIPGKLQTYMAKGKAIMGAISYDTKEIIELSNAGLCVESGDYVGLSEKMLQYIENPECVESFGKNSYDYYKNNFAKEKFIDSLNHYLRGEKEICLKEKNYSSQGVQDLLETQFLEDSLIQTLKR